jgi:hypothetical protein
LVIRFELGRLLLKMGRIGEALSELQKAQSNSKCRLEAMKLIAEAFAARGMHDMAERKLREFEKEGGRRDPPEEGGSAVAGVRPPRGPTGPLSGGEAKEFPKESDRGG